MTISGIFRGVGKQYLAAIINFLCYNVLGLSVGVPLALKANLGTIGLWTGLATGNVIQVLGIIMKMLISLLFFVISVLLLATPAVLLITGAHFSLGF